MEMGRYPRLPHNPMSPRHLNSKTLWGQWGATLRLHPMPNQTRATTRGLLYTVCSNVRSGEVMRPVTMHQSSDAQTSYPEEPPRRHGTKSPRVTTTPVLGPPSSDPIPAVMPEGPGAFPLGGRGSPRWSLSGYRGMSVMWMHTLSSDQPRGTQGPGRSVWLQQGVGLSALGMGAQQTRSRRDSEGTLTRPDS